MPTQLKLRAMFAQIDVYRTFSLFSSCFLTEMEFWWTEVRGTESERDCPAQPT